MDGFITPSVPTQKGAIWRLFAWEDSDFDPKQRRRGMNCGILPHIPDIWKQQLPLVDLVGFEPMTSALRTQRSPN